MEEKETAVEVDKEEEVNLEDNSDSDDEEVTKEFKAFFREMHLNGTLLPILKQSEDEKENIHLQLKYRGISGMGHYGKLRERNPAFYQDRDTVEDKYNHIEFVQSFLLSHYVDRFSIGSALIDSMHYILSVVYKRFMASSKSRL